MKKKLAVSILLLIMGTLLSFSTFADFYDRFGNLRKEPGSGSTTVDFNNVTRGLYYDGTDYYYVMEQGVIATDYLLNLRGEVHYFGDDGKMVKDDIVEYDGEKYFFDPNGNMLKNVWVTHEEMDPFDGTKEVTAYYFGPTGRAYRADQSSGRAIAIKTISEYKYGFDADGVRLEGYVDENGEKIDPEDPAYLTCEYYFDPDQDYAAATGFVEYYGEVDEDDLETRFGNQGVNSQIVLYFDEKTCKKVHALMPGTFIARVVEGERYLFDDVGIRQHHWAKKASPSGTTNMVSAHMYYSDDYDGYLSKGWFDAVPDRYSTMPKNREKYDLQEEETFYADSKGKIVRDCIKKIGKYYYCFDKDGVMQYDALVRVKDGQVIDTYSIDDLERKDVVLPASKGGKLQPGEKWMYFTYPEDAESDDDGGPGKMGSMCPLNKEVTIELADDDIIFMANSRGGYSNESDMEQPVLRNNKYIQNGVVLKPVDDAKYGIVWQKDPNDGSDKYFLVNKNGQQVKKAGANKDENNYLLLTGDNNGRYLGTYNFKTCKIKTPNADPALILWEWEDDDKTKHTGSLDGSLGDTSMDEYRITSDEDIYLNFTSYGDLW